MGKQGIALKYGVHRTFDGRQSGDVLAAGKNLARIGQFQAGNDAQQGGFTTARRSQQREKLPGLDIQGDVVQGFDLAKGLADILCG